MEAVDNSLRALNPESLKEWKPEDQHFWESEGKKIAWRTLVITTIALLLSFSTWFIMSVLATKLPEIGFKFTEKQMFWLVAMPGLSGGTLRILHMFLIPIYGSRKVITISTLAKIIPMVGIAFAVINPGTPYWMFLVLALLCGFGGGDFSSFMPSTSIHFPKRLQGTALGIQAGIGNFGVSLVQFVTPAIIGIALVGTSQTLTSKKTGAVSEVYLQNAAIWYVPLLLIIAWFSWKYIKRIPVTASIHEQMDIFKNKHTWFCTITYMMTFGVFSGLAAVFPLLIKNIYSGFEGGPNPLDYAFLGPLIGSASRVLFGPVADKFGGGILIHITGLVIIICIGLLTFGGLLTPENLDSFPYFLAAMLTIFFVTGIGNAATFRQFPIIFSNSPRQAAGVIGFTAAIAAYGPFIFSMLIGVVIGAFGNTKVFFYGLAIYAVIATSVNWWYYTRKKCEKPS